MEYITLSIVEKATNRRRISKCVQPELCQEQKASITFQYDNHFQQERFPSLKYLKISF